MAFAKFLPLIGLLLAAYASTTDAAVPKYGYTGPNGPSNWGNLSPDYSMCSKGKMQSPINIVTSNASKPDNTAAPIKRNYNSSTNGTFLVNTGAHIEVRLQTSDGNTFWTMPYNLELIRFHTPAEHSIDGKKFPLEAQIIHRTYKGNPLMVSILYELGSPDTFLHALQEPLALMAKDKCGENEESHVLVEKKLQTKTLTKSGGKYYSYSGSETIPPCDEGLRWFITKKVRTVSQEQLDALRAPLAKEYQNNARPQFVRDDLNLVQEYVG